jgi:hypothetical protein
MRVDRKLGCSAAHPGVGAGKEMKKLIIIFITMIAICTGCASVNFSNSAVKYHMPENGITVRDNKIFHNGNLFAELRFYFKEPFPIAAHKGLAIYYENKKELVWIFPEEGRDEDVKRGYFKSRGQTDGYVGYAYDVSISDDGKLIYWKKPGLISQISYVFSVEHGVSERIKTDWHFLW